MTLTRRDLLRSAGATGALTVAGLVLSSGIRSRPVAAAGITDAGILASLVTLEDQAVFLLGLPAVKTGADGTNSQSPGASSASAAGSTAASSSSNSGQGGGGGAGGGAAGGGAGPGSAGGPGAGGASGNATGPGQGAASAPSSSSSVSSGPPPVSPAQAIAGFVDVHRSHRDVLAQALARLGGVVPPIDLAYPSLQPAGTDAGALLPAIARLEDTLLGAQYGSLPALSSHPLIGLVASLMPATVEMQTTLLLAIPAPLPGTGGLVTGSGQAAVAIAQGAQVIPGADAGGAAAATTTSASGSSGGAAASAVASSAPSATP